ncbi:basic secretory protein [Dillenia turbinata]|uniref:Basic secretory protein n=1 Tax=Dillenia turbinata TaxID=194707 RepID=A0AAN8YZK0_9MAGN
MEDDHLLQPLLPPSTTTTTISCKPVCENKTLHVNPKVSNCDIIIRSTFLLFICVISLWANYEASKGFKVTIINGASKHTLAGRRFNLFYVSNDKTTRIVLKTSKYAQSILYPNNLQSKKQVDGVTIWLANQNLTHSITVESIKKHEFILSISPSIMEEKNFDHAMADAIQRGMARVWLFDGEGDAPTRVIDGIVEYIATSASGGGFSSTSSGEEVFEDCDKVRWEGLDTMSVAHLLHYCETINNGYIQRLNQGMRFRWGNDPTAEDDLNLPRDPNVV